MKDIDGVQLSMTDFGDKGFITLDPGAGMLEEQISFSGLTSNTNGTTTLTGVKTVLCKSPYTETSGIAKQHSGGSSAVVAVTSGLLNQFVDSTNNETITGTYTFTTANRPKLTADAETPVNEKLVEYGQLYRTAIAGAVDADTTHKGVIEIATPAQMGAGTATGETGALLVPPNSQLVKTSSGAGDENKIPVLDSAGTLANGFVDKARTWGTVQSFTANNCQITTDADSANDAVRKSYLDAIIAYNQGIGTSGEAFSIGDALYIKASDGLLYKAIGTGDESTYSFVGIALDAAAGASVANIRYARPGGVASGLTGLTAGSYYYITDTAGTIGATPGTRLAKIGQALTTTTLRVCEPKFIRSGTQAVDGNNDYVITTGFYPSKISLLVGSEHLAALGYSAFSISQEGSNLHQTSDGTRNVTDLTASLGYLVGTNTTSHLGSILSRSQTGFTIRNVETGTTGGTVVGWMAESL
jgi:hypothetical protein